MLFYLTLGRKTVKLSDERYEEIKTEVVELYKELHLTSFPVNAMDVCKKLGIILKSYNKLDDKTYITVIRASEDGLVAKIEDHYVIYYNPSKSTERIRFTVFHEIGHIILRHLIHDEENEAEANFFAGYFIAPAPLIHYFKLNCEQEIMDKFWTTYSVAGHALSRYTKWYICTGGDYNSYELELIKLATEGEKKAL